MPGLRISFATSAAKAAGGMRLSARLAASGSSRPFSKKSGSTRHARIVMPHETKMIQNSDHAI